MINIKSYIVAGVLLYVTHMAGMHRELSSPYCLTHASSRDLTALEEKKHTKIQQQKLYTAAAAGDRNALQQALADGAALDGNELIYATQQNQETVVKELWKQGAALYHYTGYAEKALLEATQAGLIDLATFFIEHGVNVHTHYERALSNAVEIGNLTLARLLIEHYGANPNIPDHRPLTLAAENGHLPIVLYLAERTQNLDVHGRTALRAAARNGHAHIVTYFLTHGVPFHAISTPDIQDSALHAAALSGHTHIAELLCDDQTTEIELSDAIRTAFYSKHQTFIDWLLLRGLHIPCTRPNH